MATIYNSIISYNPLEGNINKNTAEKLTTFTSSGNSFSKTGQDKSIEEEISPVEENSEIRISSGMSEETHTIAAGRLPDQPCLPNSAAYTPTLPESVPQRIAELVSRHQAMLLTTPGFHHDNGTEQAGAREIEEILSKPFPLNEILHAIESPGEPEAGHEALIEMVENAWDQSLYFTFYEMLARVVVDEELPAHSLRDISHFPSETPSDEVKDLVPKALLRFVEEFNPHLHGPTARAMCRDFAEQSLCQPIGLSDVLVALMTAANDPDMKNSKYARTIALDLRGHRKGKLSPLDVIADSQFFNDKPEFHSLVSGKSVKRERANGSKYKVTYKIAERQLPLLALEFLGRLEIGLTSDELKYLMNLALLRLPRFIQDERMVSEILRFYYSEHGWGTVALKEQLPRGRVTAYGAESFTKIKKVA